MPSWSCADDSSSLGDLNRLRIVVRISGARTKKWADLSRLKKEQPPKLIRNERKSRDELPTLDTYGLKRTSLQRLNLALHFPLDDLHRVKQCMQSKAAGRYSYVRSTALSTKLPVQPIGLLRDENFKRCAKGRWSWNRGCHLSRLNKNSFKLDVPHRYFRTTVFLFFLFCLFQCLFGCVRRLV